MEEVESKDDGENQGHPDSEERISNSSCGLSTSNSPTGSNFNHDHQLSSPGRRGTSFNTDQLLTSSNVNSSLNSSRPEKLGTNPVSSNASPELLHIVDSAIMGNFTNLEKLKKIVSGIERLGDGDDAKTISFLIIESLFVTMGGVEVFQGYEDKNPPSVMLNSKAAIVAGELIPSLQCAGDDINYMSPRTLMVKGLLGILRASARNRAMCSTAGLLIVLLRAAERVFVRDNVSVDPVEWNGTPLCHCIQLLAEHSLSVNDLHMWFEVITKTLTTPWAKCLMYSLEKAMRGKECRGPACTFEFDGDSSGLLSPEEKCWPFNNGYAFATWIYVESFTAITTVESTIDMPRLFSFRSTDNQGMEAYFHAQYLVIEYTSGKGKKSSFQFTHAFKPQHWYFIGLEHTGKQGLLGKVETNINLYIDGSLSESHPFDFLRISKPLSFCCIGTNPPPISAGSQHRHRRCSLFAETGPIYIFQEPIGSDKMERLAFRGGDFFPSVTDVLGSAWLTKNDHVKGIAEDSVLLDTEIAGCLHLLYHPYLLTGQNCLDASPTSASGEHRKIAKVIGQVHVARRMRPLESLWAIADGGPMSLLPLLVNNVYDNTLEPKQGDTHLSLATFTLAAPIIRILTMASRYHGNNEELLHRRGPEVLSRVLSFLMQSMSSIDVKKNDEAKDEELVAAIVSLCQSQKYSDDLKVQLFRFLLLDLKMWSPCSYGLQKKVLSSLADMVFTEASVMRNANAIQMLLDGCRKCYWTIHEAESADSLIINKEKHPVGEVNALVEEILVVVELLILAAPPSLANDDICCLLGFMVDCPQPHQVTRTLHLLYRLVVQPNSSRSRTFAEAFISCGGVEMILVLLQREAKIEDCEEPDPSLKDDEFCTTNDKDEDNSGMGFESSSLDEISDSVRISNPRSYDINNGGVSRMSFSTMDRMSSVSEFHFVKNLGGITLSISAENARNNVYNADRKDGIVVGIINLLGALVSYGHLHFGQDAPTDITNSIFGVIEEGGSMFDDKLSLALFSLQKAFQAAPNRLMTKSVYTALLTASVNESSLDEDPNFYDCGHRFEHLHLLRVLLHSLPYASTAFQMRALQDLLVLACSHPDNKSTLTKMDDWPEWILEIFISNYETSGSGKTNSTGLQEVEDFIHNFLLVILEHSMYRKDGWQDIEAIIHCVEWLSMVGGSSTGTQRIRREESLPIFKRKLLGGLLDFATRELHEQTRVIANAIASTVSCGLPPRDANAKAENASELLVSLVENAVVLLMLVEDHLRLQSKLHCTSRFSSGSVSPLLAAFPFGIHSCSTPKGEAPDIGVDSKSSSTDTRGLPLDTVPSMVDASGELSPSAVEKLAAASAAEPYESVNFAFASYGSCTKDLANGWKYRSRLWYGVGLSSDTSEFGGGGGGWESWKLSVEKDSDGNWIELPLLKKGLTMLQALLLEQSLPSSLYQLLDSDQPFLCILRMVLVSLREEDDGKENMLKKNENLTDGSSEDPQSMLLWSVLSPVLNMPTSESKRQRVLVASCILYSEVYHAVGKDKKPLRKQYLEVILPPFVAMLRRWRPLLAGIPELANADGLNPLVSDDRALDSNIFPIEAALAMISPEWAAAFASPPAAMALAMIAAGTAGGETRVPSSTVQLRRDSSLLERKTIKLHTFSSFQKPLEATNNISPASPRDKAMAKASALAAARDLERNAKVGSGRGLSAVAMATSAQRRSKTDTVRVKRWNLFEAMRTAWTECLQSVDSKSVYGTGFNGLSLKFIAVFVGSLALARNMQRSEVDRRTQVDLLARCHFYTGLHEWRKLVHCLIETKRLFSPFSNRFYEPPHVSWKLDSTESSERMRRCFRRNHQDTAHLGADKSNKYPAEQMQGKKYNVLSPLEVLNLAAKAVSMDVVNDEDIYENNASLKGPSNDVEQEEKDHEERIFLEIPSTIVRPSKILRGTLQITSRRLHFIVDNVAKNISGDGSDNIEGDEIVGKFKTWSLSSLHQIYSRRYFLRRSALELFMVDRSNIFVDFGSIEGRQNAYRALVQAHPPNINNIYLETQKPEQLFQKTQLMERWARREMTNFEYLMQLNTIAGRSYNDITQYPVFPWILSDYKSSTLDLSDPCSYRDLSKPIGALNSDRLKEFQERYSSFSDPTIPKFLYSSHYSNPKTVLYYLGRVEPFFTLYINSQGGENHADTLFSDVGATWNGVLEDMNDIKELVPELFYLPEMLTNESLADIDSIRLPPWADNSIDFVQKHRMALESEHVSAHLHEWIDLVFGYKQQGEEAILADNVFPYITYEQTIDIDKVSDPVQQQAIQDQIAYFGQTPSQLLTVPHMKRMPHCYENTIFRNPKLVESYAIPHPEHCNLPAAALRVLADALVIVDVNGPAVHIGQYKRQQNTTDDQGTPFLFERTKESENIGGTLVWNFKGSSSSGTDEWLSPQALTFHASGNRSSSIVSITRDKEIITGGHADNSIKLISIDGEKTVEIAKGHCAPVSCLALSPDDCYLITGSHDATVLLWRLQKCKKHRIEGPIQVLRGHMGKVTSCCINSDIGVVVSCSGSSDVLLHSVRKGRLIRRLSGIEANAVCLSPDGVIVLWDKSHSVISSFTLNGVFIARAYLPLTSCITCIEVSADGRSVLIALKASPNDKLKLGRLGNDIESVPEETIAGNRLEIALPSICLFDLYTLKMFHSFKLEEGQDITALALNDNNTNLLVSTKDKQLIVFTDPTLTSEAAEE
ncbi:hypothetical protein Leryth_023201 [Lithospermum erythrorhizon]|nr:hypothetical protein Leryth_023201 [Lithospermum erythrorhizon]